nr:glycosyltransferase [Marinibactrum halimedae]
MYPDHCSIPFSVIPHHHYHGWYQNKLSECDSDAYFEKTGTNLLSYGKIRSHKGIETLVRVFKQLDSKSTHLHIAGNLGKHGISTDVKSTIDQDNNISACFKHISDEETADLFQSSDAIVLPYTTVLNSGTAILALTFHKPIIAPAISTFNDLKKVFGEQWLYLYEQPLTAEKLNEALNWLSHRDKNASLDLSSLSPQVVAEQTVDFYRQVINHND